jgi:PAS domain S-box-containing protein
MLWCLGGPYKGQAVDQHPNSKRNDGVRRLGPGRLAWLPIPILLAAMVAFWAADFQGSYESDYLLLVLNFHFSLLVCLFVAYLIARSFLVRGTPGLLLLGCGVVIWGPAGVVATAAAHGDTNMSITIHNSCVWLSAVCHLVGVSLSLRPSRSLSPPALWLPGAYLLAAGAVMLVTQSARAGWIPTFFVPDRGGTPMRQVVLFSAIVMFALTASLLGATRHRSTSAFTYWYALALALIAAGLSGVLLQTYHASILGWTGRVTQSLGGLYMLIAAVASVRETRVWGISLEATLRESEERYRTLVETAPDAIVVHRDGRLLYANTEALALVGAESFEQLTQHTILDFFRPIEHERIAERMNRAMGGDRLPVREGTLLRLDGKEITAEFHTAPVDFRGTRAILTIIHDITDRKQAEEALRELNATLESKVAQRTAELEYRAKQLQRLTLELSQAEDRERKRIAALLHEDLQQYLAGAKFHLNLLRQGPRDGPPPAIIDRIDGILKEAIDKSRSLCRDLSPAVLHMNDLSEVLRWLAGQAQAKHGLMVRVDVPGEAILVSETLAMFLSRVTQELLFNVVKHAGVSEAALRLRRMRGCLRLRVVDKGQGFDTEAPTEITGLGLLSIRERVALLGGRMKVCSVKGRGSAVLVAIPDNATPGTEPSGGNMDESARDLGARTGSAASTPIGATGCR